LVTLIVKKAYHMAETMKIPVLGIVENMSYLRCPDCGKRIELFGESRVAETANALGIQLLGQLLVDPVLAKASDRGEIEKLNRDYMADTVAVLEKTFKK
jgi:Mrp family chromosome partitioning ATPase